MSLHAFVDESVRGRYMLCAVLVPSHRVNEIRKLARQLRLPGQRRWHFSDESDRQRRKILDTIAKEGCFHTLLYSGFSGKGSQVAVRRECMTALVCDLVERKTKRLVIETVSTLRAADRRCIAATLLKADAEMDYTHMSPHEEPGLWIPDAIVWAYGAGGHWRRRIESTIEVVRDLGDFT